MSAELLKRDRLAYDSADSLLRSFGMHSLQVGEQYEGKDFRDTMHLSATGGYKLAQQTAVELEKIAKQLGYDE